jgi:hypothetical protein
MIHAKKHDSQMKTNHLLLIKALMHARISIMENILVIKYTNTNSL